MLALFSVVSPQVVAPRGSGLLSNQLGSPRGLRAPLLGKFWQQSMDQVRVCVQLEQVKRGDGVSHWPEVLCSSQSVSSEPDQEWGRGDSLKENKGLDAGQPTAAKVQDLISPTQMYPSTMARFTLHLTSVPLTYLCPLCLQGEESSPFVPQSRCTSVPGS